MNGNDESAVRLSSLLRRHPDWIVPVAVATLAFAVDAALVHLLHVRTWTLWLTGLALVFALLGRRSGYVALRDALLLLCLASVPLLAIYGDRLPNRARFTLNTPATVAVVLLITAAMHRNGIGLLFATRSWRAAWPGMQKGLGVLGNLLFALFWASAARKFVPSDGSMPAWLLLPPLLLLVGRGFPSAWSLLRGLTLGLGTFGIAYGVYGVLANRWSLESFTPVLASLLVHERPSARERERDRLPRRVVPGAEPPQTTSNSSNSPPIAFSRAR